MTAPINFSKIELYCGVSANFRDFKPPGKMRGVAVKDVKLSIIFIHLPQYDATFETQKIVKFILSSPFIQFVRRVGVATDGGCGTTVSTPSPAEAFIFAREACLLLIVENL